MMINKLILFLIIFRYWTVRFQKKPSLLTLKFYFLHAFKNRFPRNFNCQWWIYILYILLFLTNIACSFLWYQDFSTWVNNIRVKSVIPLLSAIEKQICNWQGANYKCVFRFWNFSVNLRLFNPKVILKHNDRSENMNISTSSAGKWLVFWNSSGAFHSGSFVRRTRRTKLNLFNFVHIRSRRIIQTFYRFGRRKKLPKLNAAFKERQYVAQGSMDRGAPRYPPWGPGL